MGWGIGHLAQRGPKYPLKLTWGISLLKVPVQTSSQNIRFEAKFWRRIPLISCGTTPFFKGSHPLEPGREKAKQGLIFAEQSSLFFLLRGGAGQASLIYTSEDDVQLSNTKDPPSPLVVTFWFNLSPVHYGQFYFYFSCKNRELS